MVNFFCKNIPSAVKYVLVQLNFLIKEIKEKWSRLHVMVEHPVLSANGYKLLFLLQQEIFVSTMQYKYKLQSSVCKSEEHK